MGASAQLTRGNGPRRSILDLAPLELDCMNALWPLGQATVREIRQSLTPSRPRAYTTIMTIMDRLARKGVVARQKAGRAYVYRPNLSAEEARRHAIAQVVEGFFAGSAEALQAHLGGGAEVSQAAKVGRVRGVEPRISRPGAEPVEAAKADEVPQVSRPGRLDESLL